MKKLYIFIGAIGFASPVFAQGMPKEAIYVGLGGSGALANFSSQSIQATGTSNVFSTATGEHISSGSAGGPPVVRSLSTEASFAPSMQAGFFEHIMDTKWVWGAKFSYSHVGGNSSTQAFLIPQYGSFGTTSFTGNALVQSFRASVIHQVFLLPYVGYSFDRSYVYVGGGPTRSRVKTQINGLIGFADITGARTDVSGNPQNFSNSTWVNGGAATVGITYFLDQSWFVDLNYTYSGMRQVTANYASTYSNVNGDRTYTGSLIGSSTGSTRTHLFGLSINRAL